MSHTIEPAHVVMLRGALRTSYYGTYHIRDLNHNARKLSLWARITRPVTQFAELAQLPLGLVLLALGKEI